MNSVIQMQTQTHEELQMAQTSMSQIQSTGTMEIGIVIVVDTAIVLLIMLYTVRERTREIGTLKALGVVAWQFWVSLCLKAYCLA